MNKSSYYCGAIEELYIETNTVNTIVQFFFSTLINKNKLFLGFFKGKKFIGESRIC